jgi:drug/metabolite transporter (DMT)-like permease
VTSPNISGNRLTLRTCLLMLTVGALWGASFLFMRVAAPVLGPVALIEARVLLAGLALLVVVALLRQAPAWRKDWKGYLVLGALAAGPFTLIAAAELRITASLAAILNATVPLFTLLIAAARGQETLTARRVAGVLLGVFGVAVLVGLGPLQLDVNLFAAAGASLFAALLLAAGGVYAKTCFPSTPPTTLAAGQQLAAAVLLLPPALALPPNAVPDVGTGAAVLALALGCTALGFGLFYRLLARVGPTGALSVTFLVPVFGIAWGTLFLGEHPTLATGTGLLIILAGIALVNAGQRGHPRLHGEHVQDHPRYRSGCREPTG